MATLEINGKRVQVDDSFRDLTPEQQQATVEEIARSMGVGAGQPQSFSQMREAGMIEQAPGNEDLWMPDAPQTTEPQSGAVPTLPGVIGDIQNAERAFSNAMTQGATFGFADEIAAGVAAPFRAAASGQTLPQAFEGQIDDIRALETDIAGRNPIASTAGNIAGAVGTGVGLARGGVSLMNGARPTVTSMGTRGAAEGAAYGALHGFGTGESMDERIGQAIGGALAGGAMGGALGAGAGALANRAAQNAAPTVDELRTQAGALYDAARDSGVVFPQSVVRSAADDIAARAISEGLDETLHPGAAAALRRLQQAAQTGMTAQQAQTMRRVLAAAAKDPTKPDQARIASEMIRMFDEQITGSIPNLSSANALYSQSRKGQMIEDIFTRAQDTLGRTYNNAGMVTALKNEFGRLLNNQKALRGFSEAEVQAIRDFVRGGPVDGFLRWAGRFAPTGVVPMATTIGAGAGIGAMAGSPVAGGLAAGTAMGAGVLARGAGNAMAMNQANQIGALLRSGAPLQISPARKAIVDALIAGQASEAPRVPAASQELVNALVSRTF